MKGMPEKPSPLGSYLNTELECPCGHVHYVPIEAVEIGPGAIKTLPGHVSSRGYKRPYIICDAITYKIAAARCEELIRAQGIDAKLHVLTHLGFDESTLGEILINKPEDCDVIIGVGTGSITDMLRYSSFKVGLPCITVATGAPMDGFAASIGIMNVNSLKCTMNAHTTQVVIGDTDILATAPYRMTVAGFGDLIGKITCLNDWELARIISGEHYCGRIVELVRNCVDDILLQAPLIKQRDPSTLGKVMEGLVLSGSAISLYGNSRPASGAEHHMSHYWETIMDQRGIRNSMHGEQVAVGTVLALMLCRMLAETKPDFNAARKAAESYDPAEWESEVRRAYGPAADEIITLEANACKNRPENVLRRIDSMEEHWDEIVAQLNTLPSAEKLISVLREVGCPSVPADIGIDDELLKDTFLYCKEVRARYTVFQTAYDLGLLESLSDRIISELHVLHS